MKKVFLFLFFIYSAFVQSQIEFVDSINYLGENRSYLAYVPDSYDGSTAYPLLFTLTNASYGYDDDLEYISWSVFDEYDWKNIADTSGVILIHPLPKIEPDKGDSTLPIYAYHKYDLDPFGTDLSEAYTCDDCFISNLIDSISLNYQIDQCRIYATSYLLTGNTTNNFAYTLACRLSNRIAAVGLVTAPMAYPNDYFNFPACIPSESISIISLYTIDENNTIPPYSYDGFMEYGYAPQDTVISFWINHNNLNAQPVETNIPDTVLPPYDVFPGGIKKTWSNDNTCETLEQITWEGDPSAFLTYPGIPTQGGWMDLHASREIWNFISQYNINGKISCNNISNCNTSFNCIPDGRCTPNLQVVELSQNSKNLIQILDMMGRETSFKPNTPLIYVYDDGSTEKVFKIE